MPGAKSISAGLQQLQLQRSDAYVAYLRSQYILEAGSIALASFERIYGAPSAIPNPLQHPDLIAPLADSFQTLYNAGAFTEEWLEKHREGAQAAEAASHAAR